MVQDDDDDEDITQFIEHISFAIPILLCGNVFDILRHEPYQCDEECYEYLFTYSFEDMYSMTSLKKYLAE